MPGRRQKIPDEEAIVTDEQERAEALDDDKGAFPVDEEPVIDLLDQTADADPAEVDRVGRLLGATDAGDGLVGDVAPRERDDDPFHREEPPAEVAALHLVEDDRM